MTIDHLTLDWCLRIEIKIFRKSGVISIIESWFSTTNSSFTLLCIGISCILNSKCSNTMVIISENLLCSKIHNQIDIWNSNTLFCNICCYNNTWLIRCLDKEFILFTCWHLCMKWEYFNCISKSSPNFINLHLNFFFSWSKYEYILLCYDCISEIIHE